MTLEEYWAKNEPEPDNPQERAEMVSIADEIDQQQRDAAERQGETEHGLAIKEKIMTHLERGTETELILYMALDAIGLLAHDTDWTAEARGHLDTVYKDLEQRSFIADNEAIAADRLLQTAQEYNTKLQKQLRTQLFKYRKVTSELDALIQDLSELNTCESMKQDSEQPQNDS